MNEVIEVLYNYRDCCQLAKRALRQVGRFGKLFRKQELGPDELAHELVQYYDGTFADLNNQLVALCPLEGSLVPLLKSLYLYGHYVNPDLLHAVIDACVIVEARRANAECRTIATCYRTPARAKRTVLAMAYDAVRETVLLSDKYSLDCLYGTEDSLRDELDDEKWGWKFDAHMNGYWRITEIMQNGDYIGYYVLEIIVRGQYMPGIPFPDEELNGVISLVIYGIARPHVMRNTVKGILQRIPGLRHFAALNVVTDEDSFDILSQVNLPELSIVLIDIQESWSNLFGDDGESYPDGVVSALNMLKNIKNAIEPNHHCVTLIFRHDLDKSPVDSDDDEEEYTPCPGVIHYIP